MQELRFSSSYTTAVFGLSWSYCIQTLSSETVTNTFIIFSWITWVLLLCWEALYSVGNSCLFHIHPSQFPTSLAL